MFQDKASGPHDLAHYYGASTFLMPVTRCERLRTGVAKGTLMLLTSRPRWHYNGVCLKEVRAGTLCAVVIVCSTHCVFLCFSLES